MASQPSDCVWGFVRGLLSIPFVIERTAIGISTGVGHRHDLVEKVRYYLKHEDERAAIAQAGYERTLREHTYVHRFRDIFGQMGLSGSSVIDLADLKAQPGSTQEVQ